MQAATVLFQWHHADTGAGTLRACLSVRVEFGTPAPATTSVRKPLPCHTIIRTFTYSSTSEKMFGQYICPSSGTTSNTGVSHVNLACIELGHA